MLKVVITHIKPSISDCLKVILQTNTTQQTNASNENAIHFDVQLWTLAASYDIQDDTRMHMPRFNSRKWINNKRLLECWLQIQTPVKFVSVYRHESSLQKGDVNVQPSHAFPRRYIRSNEWPEAVRISAIQLQYNYNNITQKFCCIAAVRTSAIQLQYKFFSHYCCK